MSEPDELRLELARMMRKAFRSLGVAEALTDEGSYDFASSRAYYAAFYSMEAMLLTKTLSFSKHGGVMGGFNRHFVKTGAFPKEFSKFISRLFRERQIGDYEFDLSIGEDDAREDVRIAETVVRAIAEWLRNEGLLSADDGLEAGGG